jgi:hypothetical protein
MYENVTQKETSEKIKKLDNTIAINKSESENIEEVKNLLDKKY